MSKEERKAKKTEKKAKKKAEKERLYRLKMTPKALILYIILYYVGYAYLYEGFLTKEDIGRVKTKFKKSKGNDADAVEG